MQPSAVTAAPSDEQVSSLLVSTTMASGDPIWKLAFHLLMPWERLHQFRFFTFFFVFELLRARTGQTDGRTRRVMWLTGRRPHNSNSVSNSYEQQVRSVVNIPFSTALYYAAVCYTGCAKKWHPYQVRQYNVIQTKKHQIFTPFEQFQHSLLLIHRVMCSLCPACCCTTRV